MPTRRKPYSMMAVAIPRRAAGGMAANERALGALAPPWAHAFLQSWSVGIIGLALAWNAFVQLRHLRTQHG
jgi:hypothetical protein